MTAWDEMWRKPFEDGAHYATKHLVEESKTRTLRKPPSLQELVEKHGGYHLITREAWAEYDYDLAKWKADAGLGEGDLRPTARSPWGLHK